MRKRITVYNEVPNDVPEVVNFTNTLRKKNDVFHSNNLSRELKTHTKVTMFGLIKTKLQSNIKTKK